ncbi:hypothetical protein WN55_00864 [Dufourea novaeangliae]|uniref:Uncharacterized protein n=1 Tax=Dufourea novaeangliae TaxID=178035 RepID=A0A154PCS4_DUFNO|nr:hypothetical protein WN55_00864 [Dufourea novaeangliae]
MHCTLREVPNCNLTLVDHGCNNYFRGWLTYVAEFCDYIMDGEILISALFSQINYRSHFDLLGLPYLRQQ